MRVAIVGTGLIGASIGLALREREPEARVVGYDRNREVLDAARRIGAIQETAMSAADAARGTDFIIIATPVLAIARVLEEIAPVVSPDAVITDTGSSKSQILHWAREYLGDHRGFVGSHPMAGKTEYGPGNGEATLFEGARWVVVPPVTASDRAIETVINLAKLLGAKTMIMDPGEHDAYVAAISHMPMVAATALFSMGRASEAWPELSLLAAGGYRDMTRLAGTEPAMAYDILVTNRANVVHWLDRYVAILLEMRRRVLDTDAEDELYQLMQATEDEYLKYRLGKVGREEEGESVLPKTSTSDFMTDFVAGTWAREKMQEMLKGSEDRLREMDERERKRRNV